MRAARNGPHSDFATGLMLAAFAIQLLLQAQVHVIDDDGGPGVAVAAALPGDVLLVREGAC